MIIFFAVNFQINPKTWPNLRINDLIEILSSSAAISAVYGPSLLAGQGHLTSSLNRATSSSLLSTSNTSTSSNNTNPNAFSVTGSSTTANLDDDTSPFLVHVSQTSFNESIAIDTISIDRAASSAPFSIRPLGFVSATVVDRSVR